MKSKQILAGLALACAAALSLNSWAQQSAKLQGEVLEVLNVPTYTYLRLKTAQGETWAAVSTADVVKGAKVTINDAMTMENFQSQTLNRRFDKIVFGQLAQPGAPIATAGAAPAATFSIEAVAKAAGPESRTVAEVVTGKAALKDKTVLVRGRVVKVNNGIMGKNWVHLRDGSGAEADGSNDLLVTTKDSAAVGEIVSSRGTVRTDVKLGSGYDFAVLVENAALKK